MKIEIDLSLYLGPDDADVLERLLARGWSLRPGFGPVFSLRHRTMIADEPTTKLIELNGETWHGSGLEATLAGERSSVSREAQVFTQGAAETASRIKVWIAHRCG